MGNQGWECPKCGYVYSPMHSSCDNCNRPLNEKIFTSTGTDITMQKDGYCKCWPPKNGMLTNGSCATCNKPIPGGGLLR